MDPFHEFHSKNLEFYRSLIKEPSIPSGSFWDIVVITAANENQASCFREQIEERLNVHHSIPNCQYLVVSDPPGPKIGSGGATMAVLMQLKEKFPEFESMRVLLIHAGGYSKRLPNHSTLGKIFAPVPLEIGGCLASMLELKLLMFSRFSFGHMPHGVFVTCADEITLFDPTAVKFSATGVTALAHPSPIEIGTTHGVFVLGGPQKDTPTSDLVVCEKFLHKPSVEKMKSERAETRTDSNEVYTDSSYFMAMDYANQLVRFYTAHLDLACEIDCYGDFLQPLGTHADPSMWLTDTTNVTHSCGSLLHMRTQLADHMKDLPLFAAPLHPSKFYHIGTLCEYSEHYSPMSQFWRHMSCANEIASFVELEGARTSAASSILQSLITTPHVSIGNNTVLEFCKITSSESDFNPSEVENPKPEQEGVENCQISTPSGLRIGDGCVLSGVELIVSNDGIISVPDGIFATTLPIDGKGYVTLVMGTRDDPKSNSGTFANGCKNLNSEKMGISADSIWPQGGDRTLWAAKLFPICETPHQSFAASMRLLVQREEGMGEIVTGERLSFAEAISMASHTLLLQKQRDLKLSVLAHSVLKCFNDEMPVSEWPDITTGGSDMNMAAAVCQKAVEIFCSQKQRDVQKIELLESLVLKKIRLLTCLSHCLSTQKATQKEIEIPTLESRIRSLSECSQFLLHDLIVLPMCTFTEEGQEGDQDAHVGMLKAMAECTTANYKQNHFLPKIVSTDVQFVAAKIGNRLNSVRVDLPARINLAGGWTDTPPHALSDGGLVLNMAIAVDGKLPISAKMESFSASEKMGEKIGKLQLVCEGERLVIENVVQLFDYSNPKDDYWALLKACVAFTAFPPQLTLIQPLLFNHETKSAALPIFEQYFERFVSAIGESEIIELSTSVSLPKGSGLGTSSILALACVRAIKTFMDMGTNISSTGTQKDGPVALTLTHVDFGARPTDWEINAVLAVEQMLTTGGGWQDQVGGACGGIKLISTPPGAYPRYAIEQLLECGNMAFLDKINEKFVVVYTGKQRMAKVVLSNVTLNNALRRPETVRALKDLKTVTLQMRDAFQMLRTAETTEEFDRHIATLGDTLNSVLQCNVALSPNSMSEYLDGLCGDLRKYLCGVCIVGAGSGGYLVGVKRPDFDSSKLQEMIDEKYPLVEVCDIKIVL